MGFFASWQFGTGFSWTSHHMNITGRLSSIFFIGDKTTLSKFILIAGLGVGSLSSPPLAGWLFLLQPLNVLWLVLGMVLIQVSTELSAITFEKTLSKEISLLIHSSLLEKYRRILLILLFNLSRDVFVASQSYVAWLIEQVPVSYALWIYNLKVRYNLKCNL